MTSPADEPPAPDPKPGADEAEPSSHTEFNGPMDGAQIGQNFGDITVVKAMPARAPLVVLRLTDDEIADLKDQFVPPPEFSTACELIQHKSIVVLRGEGTGRTFTAGRLLVEQGFTKIAQISRYRQLAEIESSELRSDTGYWWYTSEFDDQAFSAHAFHEAAHAVRSAESRLVIVVDDKVRVPPEISDYAVRLSTPDATKIAQAVIDRHPERAKARLVLAEDLGKDLHGTSPPHDAVRAAELAIQVAEGKLTAADALTRLAENVDQTIAAALDGWTTLEFAMLLSVSLLENKPYDEVVKHALKLDHLIRTAEAPDGVKLWPRLVFVKPRSELLRQIRAKVESRDHPTHPGLREETIRFDRDKWADAALFHVWREYVTIHNLLLDWMSESALLTQYPHECINAVCEVTFRMPAHEPLRMIDHLAASNSYSQRKLAMWALVRLADTHDLQPLVEHALNDWVDSGSPNRKSTAALTYALRFKDGDPEQILEKLASIARNTNSAGARLSVVRAILFMLRDAPDNRDTVLAEIRSWAAATKAEPKLDGPRRVALVAARWIVGFVPDPEKTVVDAIELATAFPEHVAFLAQQVLADEEFGELALDRLAALANTSRYDYQKDPDDQAGPELVRLTKLLTPDLRWRKRRAAVARLGRRYPLRRKEIRRIFRTARGVEPATDDNPTAPMVDDYPWLARYWLIMGRTDPPPDKDS